MAKHRFGAVLAGLLMGLFAASGTEAQTVQPPHDLLLPSEIELHIHDEVKDRAFLDPLICALEGILHAPVSVKSSSLPLASFRLNSRQLDVNAIAPAFDASTRAGTAPTTFRHLVIPQDISAAGYNFLFAHRYPGSNGSGPTQVMSAARLTGVPAGTGDVEKAEATAQRLYKIILRGIVHAAGYRAQGCILAYSHFTEFFERKPTKLCERDRANLVWAGLIRAEIRPCSPLVSELEPGRRAPS